MNREDLFPPKYFRADDFPPAGLPVKIEGVTRELIGQGADQKTKPIISFVNQTKRLVMNATNYDSIADILGSSNTDDWAGRIITLYADTTRYSGKMTPCVRVKRYQKPAAVAVKPQPTEIDPPPAEGVPSDRDTDDEIF
jgi:hypothetical protein